MVVEPQRKIAAALPLFLGREELDRCPCFPGLVQPKQHLGLIAARTCSPLEFNRQALRHPGVLASLREGARGVGELFGGFLETLAGRVALMVRLVRPGDSKFDCLDPLSTAREAEIVADEGVFGEVPVPCDHLQLLGGFLRIAFGAVKQAQGETVAGGGDLLVPTVAGDEFAEAGGGESVVLLVVRPPGAARSMVAAWSGVTCAWTADTNTSPASTQLRTRRQQRLASCEFIPSTSGQWVPTSDPFLYDEREASMIIP